MASDGRNCAGRWEKLRCQMGEIALQMGEIALTRWEKLRRQMGEIALNCRKRFETPKITPKMPFWGLKTAGKWAFWSQTW